MSQNSQSPSIITCRSVLVLGGARSGKSLFAEKLVLESTKSPVYLATAQDGDEEMRSRIQEHRERRGSRWHTIEEPVSVAARLNELSSQDNVVLVDCLTLWLSNLMLKNMDVGDEIENLTSAVPKLAGSVVFVSNEVGMGIVPDNRLARSFRDLSGQMNKKLAEACDAVYFVAASHPLLLKPTIQPEIEL